jgi:excisionase family DNA binding protein
VTEPIVVAERESFMTARAGIAFAPSGVSASSLIGEASAAMRHAPRRTRGSVEVFHASMGTRGLDDTRTDNDLRRGIEDDELRVAYQPLVSLRDRSVVGVESLVRWAHPTKGQVVPARFLPLAEQSGLITRIGSWVLAEACRQAATWSKSFEDREPPTMTVNVSTRQLVDPGFPSLVEDALEAADLAPDRLVLDITEDALHDNASVDAILHELKLLGVGLFLDDFATADAAVSWLTRFPLDGVKLEPDFVGRLGLDPAVRVLLKAVCGMATAFELTVVAEGVETEDQAAILEELGCQAAQGFLFSRPVQAAQLEPLLAAGLPKRVVLPADDAPDEADATVTMREAAVALGVSSSTIRRWVEMGRLTAYRTRGGHRRFLAEDVRRLRATSNPDGPRMRRVRPPERALPHTAAFVGQQAASIVSAGLEATYEAPRGGWFADDYGRSLAERWLSKIAGALVCGEYAKAIEATMVLTRRARLGGATAEERVTFLDRACSVLLRMLSETDAARDELPAARRLCSTLRHHALADMDA